jgi:RNA polymerase-binding transcription factor DksA
MSQQEYTQKLEQELAAVVTELETIAVQSPDTGDWVAIPDSTEITSADRNVQADLTEEWNARRAVVSQLETRYQNITLALQKIEEGTYGICEITGKPIEPERLAVYPAARTNIENADRERELPL